MQAFSERVQLLRYEQYFRVDEELDEDSLRKWKEYIDPYFFIHMDLSSNRLTDFDNDLQKEWFRNIKNCLYKDCFSRSSPWIHPCFFEEDNIIRFSKIKYRLFLLDVLFKTYDKISFSQAIQSYLTEFVRSRGSMENNIFEIVGNSPFLIYVWSLCQPCPAISTSFGSYRSIMDVKFTSAITTSQRFNVSDVFPLKLTFLANDVLIRYLKILYFFFVSVKSMELDLDDNSNVVQTVFESLEDVKSLRSIKASDVFYYELSDKQKLVGLKKKWCADEGAHVIILKK